MERYETKNEPVKKALKRRKLGVVFSDKNNNK